MSASANVFLLLDQVEPRAEARYRAWQRATVASFAAFAWATRVLRFRAVDALPGGIAKGEFYPRFLTLVELATAAAPSDDALQALSRYGESGATRPLVARTYREFNVGQRDGPFLSEPSPRTLFLIGQKVFNGKDDEYNHWFDVDDASAHGTGRPPISHFRERLSYTGFIRGTRMKLRAPTADDRNDDYLVPNYVTFYEVDGPDALQSVAYTNAPQNKKSAGGGGMFRLLVRHTYVELTD